MEYCECGNRLDNTNYNLFQICFKCGNVYKEDRLIGSTLYSSKNKKKMRKFSCSCGHELIQIKSGLIEHHICLKCGRLITIPYEKNSIPIGFTYPDAYNIFKFNNTIKIHNSLFNLDPKKEFIIGKPYCLYTIPFYEAINDAEFKEKILKGYAIYEKDKYNLITGIKYIPIDINTGKILY